MRWDRRFSWTPEFVLKRYVLSNYPEHALEPADAQAVDFMVDQVESLSQETLASRLQLNTLPVKFTKGVLVPPSHPITIIEVRARAPRRSRRCSPPPSPLG